jgi:hypothetical protein
MLGKVGVKTGPALALGAGLAEGITREVTGGDSIRAAEAVGVEESFQPVMLATARTTKAIDTHCRFLSLEGAFVANFLSFGIKILRAAIIRMFGRNINGRRRSQGPKTSLR